MPHRAPHTAPSGRCDPISQPDGANIRKKMIYLRRQTLRVMKTHLLALLSLFCIGTASAQTPRDERIARAVERMDDGDYDEAARLLESVLAADPKNFLANYETGYLLYMQERYERGRRSAAPHQAQGLPAALPAAGPKGYRHGRRPQTCRQDL